MTQIPQKINWRGNGKSGLDSCPCVVSRKTRMAWIALSWCTTDEHNNILPKRAFHHYLKRVTKTTSCFGTGRSTDDFRQLRPILRLAHLLFVFDNEKDGGCYESASCFENVARWRQQHESFRLPVLLEVDSKEYSDPVVESTGEERKKNISTFFLGLLITKLSEQCLGASPLLFNQAET